MARRAKATANTITRDEVFGRLKDTGLFEFTTEDGTTWQTIVVGGTDAFDWHVLVQDRANRRQITIHGPEWDYVSGIIDTFKSDAEFRSTHLPPVRKPKIKDGTHGNSLCYYKGRTYRLLWVGKTKYGRRAKLAFLDDSKKFWADAEAVSNVRQADHPRGWEQCEGCGDYAPVLYRGLCGDCYELAQTGDL